MSRGRLEKKKEWKVWVGPVGESAIQVCRELGIMWSRLYIIVKASYAKGPFKVSLLAEGGVSDSGSNDTIPFIFSSLTFLKPWQTKD